MELKITPYCKRRVAPLRNSVKRELKDMRRYYVGNAVNGWAKGSNYANEKRIGLATAFFVKSPTGRSRPTRSTKMTRSSSSMT